jgi:hypothetical protein
MENNLANDVLAAAIRERTRLQFGAPIDASYSIQQTGGRFARASSDNGLMFALGSASLGANAWMRSGGNTELYNAERDRICKSFKAAQWGSVWGDNPDFEAFGYYRAMRQNFDRGAATAQGLGLNSISDENKATLRAGFVTKINNGYFFGTDNRAYTPNFRGLLIDRGYSQSVNRNRSLTSNPAQSKGVMI